MGLPLWGLIDNPYSDPECFDNGAPMDYNGIDCAAGDLYFENESIKEDVKNKLQQLRPKVTCQLGLELRCRLG